MTKTLPAAIVVLLLAGGTATAQDAPAAPPPPDAAQGLPDAPPPAQNGGAGIRSGNISATGRTMPGVGASKGAGTTSLDKGIQDEDNRISGSICKGC